MFCVKRKEVDDKKRYLGASQVACVIDHAPTGSGPNELSFIICKISKLSGYSENRRSRAAAAAQIQKKQNKQQKKDPGMTLTIIP